LSVAAERKTRHTHCVIVTRKSSVVIVHGCGVYASKDLKLSIVLLVPSVGAIGIDDFRDFSEKV